MIIDAFKKKIFPMTPTGFEDDVDEDEFLKKREKEGRMPAIEEVEEPKNDETFEQTTRLDKFYGSDLINEYFLENSLTKIMDKLKDYKKILKNFECIMV